MINKDFIQKVEVFEPGDTQYYQLEGVSDLAISDSIGEIPLIKFSARIENPSTAEGQTAIEKVLKATSRIRVTIEVFDDPEVIDNTYEIFGVYKGAGLKRDRAFDIYNLEFLGIEDLLTRKKFFKIFDSEYGTQTASQLVNKIVDDYNGKVSANDQITTSISSDLDNIDIPSLVCNYGSHYEMLVKVSDITSFTFKMEGNDGRVLSFFDPRNNPSDTDLETKVNMVSNTIDIKQDSNDLVNVAISEAFIYQEIEIEKEVSECVDTLFIDKFDSSIWEISEPFTLIEPEEFQDLNVNVNLDDGSITFENPLVFDVEGEVDNTRNKQSFTILARMKIRRRVLARVENPDSIDNFGEIYSHLDISEDNADIKTVFDQLKAEVRERSLPIINASIETTTFGYESGQIVRVVPDNRYPLGDGTWGSGTFIDLIVKSVEYKTSGYEISCTLQMSNSMFVGVDPVIDASKRLEKLEKVELSPVKLSGKITQQVGGGVWNGGSAANEDGDGFVFSPELKEIDENIMHEETNTTSTESFNANMSTSIKMDVTYTTS